ncbi:aminotransferase class I/II-fold pyridoxal phosphate-dependent enzyme [Saccharothrix sp. NRRL B-16314]|uniref:aminotransferase class I/II-fold pyridoxal phosphate-dependent enzyme n=1 Tax=Saccharothrix sp. NRRL B-16314 TaxID=1463825 RepID=UPI000527F3BF|nr:aminotransferase class I/II-fold pyridoxal phosphate-dependent enzyme [Saccharothrix sp. NRRL B-16314]
MPLAIGSYAGLGALADDADVLNLAWTQDERDLLDVDLMAVVSAELADEVASGLPYVNSYLVRDPYGEAALGPAVAGHFGRAGWSAGTTVGAGVGPLLHCLSTLAPRVHVVSDIYPDFPFWVDKAGGRCVFADEWDAADPVTPHLRAAADHDAAVLFLERPGITGDDFADLDRVVALCEGAAERGAVVLVDESNANYYPPAYSAVNVVDVVRNLVVVRGLSKAYGLGGLRLGYCVASAALTESVRSVVPPLHPSSLSLRIGRRVLDLGDVTSRLRDLVVARKRDAHAVLASAGVEPDLQAAEFLPYLLYTDPQGALERLAALGIQGKAHPAWSARRGELRHVGRISVPLADARWAELRARCAGERQV